MTKTRVRRVGSVKEELLKKSRESALAAVEIFNNPNIHFKSETYIVLMTIAWTYLFHAYYRDKGIEYRYYKMTGSRKKFDKTKHGADKHWELERCLNDRQCPIDASAKENLKFLIGLRHEIEHQMTTRIDDFLSARFQACCLNFNHYIKVLFQQKYGIDRHLSFSLQFSSLSEEQLELLQNAENLPQNIHNYIEGFDTDLSDDIYKDPKYAYRVIFVPKATNRKGQADRVIEFVKAGSDFAKKVNTEYALVKETERPKMLPSKVVKIMKKKGFSKFSIHYHTQLWQKHDGKNPGKGYGVEVGNLWYWYEPWLKVVEQHCRKHVAEYGYSET